MINTLLWWRNSIVRWWNDQFRWWNADFRWWNANFRWWNARQRWWNAVPAEINHCTLYTFLYCGLFPDIGHGSCGGSLWQTTPGNRIWFTAISGSWQLHVVVLVKVRTLVNFKTLQKRLSKQIINVDKCILQVGQAWDWHSLIKGCTGKLHLDDLIAVHKRPVAVLRLSDWPLVSWLPHFSIDLHDLLWQAKIIQITASMKLLMSRVRVKFRVSVSEKVRVRVIE